MSERLTKTARRTQLLRIMSTLHEQAQCREDFTVEKVAEAAGRISTVWIYKLVGAEFKELRSRLEGPRRSPGDNERRLRNEVSELQRRLRELEAKYKAEITGDFSAAIRHIEAQDERIRSLEGLVRLLERRLAKAEQDRRESQIGITDRESLKETTAPAEAEDIGDLSDVLDAVGNYSN